MNTEKLEFTGNASEYFRIWIVNLFLSIVTLGIYSAWAKVRKKKYFYRNTTLDGHNFDYHANPVAILKGRLIAVPVLGLYGASGYFFPLAQVPIGLLILLSLPWLIVRSQIFNRRNTSYRNLRFDFQPRFGQAYGVMATYGLLTTITLGLAYPLFDQRRRKFIIDNTGFGKTSFRFAGDAGKFFAIYLETFAVAIVTALVLGLLVAGWAMLPAIAQQEPSPVPGASPIPLPLLILIAILLWYFPVIAYFQARLTNYTYSVTALEDNTLACALRARNLAWIYFSNAVAICLSIGFLIPWAAVRLARYRVERTSLTVAESLDGFIGKSVHAESATGEELAEVFDIDVGI